MGNLNKPAKLCYLDTETSGLDPKRNGIIQLAAIMAVDDVEVGRFCENMRPIASLELNHEALAVSGNTVETVATFRPEGMVLAEFRKWLGQFVSQYNTNDKAFFCGYNASFDNAFVRALFEHNSDKYFGSWFWSGTIDVMGAALWALRNERAALPNFKLGTVAKHVLGSRVDELTAETGLHDALTDVLVTWELHRAVTEMRP